MLANSVTGVAMWAVWQWPEWSVHGPYWSTASPLTPYWMSVGLQWRMNVCVSAAACMHVAGLP